MITYNARLGASFSSLGALKAIVAQRLFRQAFVIALSGAVVSFAASTYKEELGITTGKTGLAGKDALFAGVISIIGFLLIFRMNQSYNRFQQGSDLAFEMVADFYDATSILISLARRHRHDTGDNFTKFNQTLIRLVSLLCTVCYDGLSNDTIGDDSEIGFSKFYEAVRPTTIDVLGLDNYTLMTVARSKCRPEVVYQFIQNLMVDHLDDVLQVPPPLLTRVVQEFGIGMIKFHEAFKLVHVPYPFPLMALSEMALIINWLATPIVFTLWCESAFGAGCFTFIVEFMLWSLLALAAEFDNPFGNDINDIDMLNLQQYLNHCLASLLEQGLAPTPTICPERAERVSSLIYDLEAFSHQIVHVSEAASERRAELHSKDASRKSDDVRAHIRTLVHEGVRGVARHGCANEPKKISALANIPSSAPGPEQADVAMLDEMAAVLKASSSSDVHVQRGPAQGGLSETAAGDPGLLEPGSPQAISVQDRNANVDVKEADRACGAVKSDVGREGKPPDGRDFSIEKFQPPESRLFHDL